MMLFFILALALLGVLMRTLYVAKKGAKRQVRKGITPQTRDEYESETETLRQQVREEEEKKEDKRRAG